MKNLKRQRKILFLPAGILLLCAVFLMGYFQINSVLRSADTARDSMRRALFGSLGRIVSELFIEERQLLYSLDMTGEEFSSGNFSHLERTLAAWYQTSGEETAVRGLYFFSRDFPGISYLYRPGRPGLVRAGSPPEGIPVFPLHGESDGILVGLDLDMDSIYGTRLPSVLQTWDDIYAWHLVPAADGVKESSRGMEGLDYIPELSVPLIQSPQAFLSDARRIQLVPPRDEDWPDTPGEARPARELFLSTIRTGENQEGRILTRDDFPDMKIWGMLEVYFRNGTLDTIIRRQIMINLTASMMALLLMSGGYLLLYKLYRRSEAQREKEQEFVAVMSHELRTPLAVISSASDNLVRGIIPEERLPVYGGMIARESRRLEEMIESVLYYSGLQNGIPRGLIREDLDIPALFGELEERYAGRAAEADIRLEFFIDPEIPLLRGNRESLTLIAGNLLNNALLHAYPPGFTVRPEDRLITVEVKREDQRLAVTVRDRGIGISARERKRIFNPFERGEESRRKQIPGSGLGLHICRRVVNQMGGKIFLDSPLRFESGREGGSEFRVIIPMESSGEKEAAGGENPDH